MIHRLQALPVYYRAFRYARFSTRLNAKYAGFASFEPVGDLGQSYTLIVEKIGLPIKESLPCIW